MLIQILHVGCTKVKPLAFFTFFIWKFIANRALDYFAWLWLVTIDRRRWNCLCFYFSFPNYEIPSNPQLPISEPIRVLEIE